MSTQMIELLDVDVEAVQSTRQTLLMCSPRLYDVSYVINPWMAGNVHASSRERAAEQWQELHDALIRIADVKLVDPEPGSPDMVFTANAGLECGGTVVLSSFFHSERQEEEKHFRRWFEKEGYRVVDIQRETPFEGEGDALFSADRTMLFVGHGPRTTESSHHALTCFGPLKVISLHLVDPRFYHLDTCFAPLNDGSVLYYPEAFSAESLAKIEARYPAGKRIIVSEQDAICFACNAVNIGRTVLLNKISRRLRTQLDFRGFDVIEIDLSEFLKAGGAAKCLVMKLSGAPHRD